MPYWINSTEASAISHFYDGVFIILAALSHSLRASIIHRTLILNGWLCGSSCQNELQLQFGKRKMIHEKRLFTFNQLTDDRAKAHLIPEGEGSSIHLSLSLPSDSFSSFFLSSTPTSFPRKRRGKEKDRGKSWPRTKRLIFCSAAATKRQKRFAWLKPGPKGSKVSNEPFQSSQRLWFCIIDPDPVAGWLSCGYT